MVILMPFPMGGAGAKGVYLDVTITEEMVKNVAPGELFATVHRNTLTWDPACWTVTIWCRGAQVGYHAKKVDCRFQGSRWTARRMARKLLKRHGKVNKARLEVWV